MSTRAQVVAAAGDLAAEQHLARLAMTPREQAEAAWTPGCGHTVDQLEAEIREERGLPALHQAS